MSREEVSHTLNTFMYMHTHSIIVMKIIVLREIISHTHHCVSTVCLQIVELKHQSLLEEKRKQAMDMHLKFIVDQTQKYSNWLVQGMTGSTPSATPSLAPSLTPSSLLSNAGMSQDVVCVCVCVCTLCVLVTFDSSTMCVQWLPQSYCCL